MKEHKYRKNRVKHQKERKAAVVPDAPVERREERKAVIAPDPQECPWLTEKAPDHQPIDRDVSTSHSLSNCTVPFHKPSASIHITFTDTEQEESDAMERRARIRRQIVLDAQRDTQRRLEAERKQSIIDEEKRERLRKETVDILQRLDATIASMRVPIPNRMPPPRQPSNKRWVDIYPRCAFPQCPRHIHVNCTACDQQDFCYACTYHDNERIHTPGHDLCGVQIIDSVYKDWCLSCVQKAALFFPGRRDAVTLSEHVESNFPSFYIDTALSLDSAEVKMVKDKLKTFDVCEALTNHAHSMNIAVFNPSGYPKHFKSIPVNKGTLLGDCNACMIVGFPCGQNVCGNAKKKKQTRIIQNLSFSPYRCYKGAAARENVPLNPSVNATCPVAKCATCHRVGYPCKEATCANRLDWIHVRGTGVMCCKCEAGLRHVPTCAFSVEEHTKRVFQDDFRREEEQRTRRAKNEQERQRFVNEQILRKQEKERMQREAKERAQREATKQVKAKTVIPGLEYEELSTKTTTKTTARGTEKVRETTRKRLFRVSADFLPPTKRRRLEPFPGYVDGEYDPTCPGYEETFPGYGERDDQSAEKQYDAEEALAAEEERDSKEIDYGDEDENEQDSLDDGGMRYDKTGKDNCTRRVNHVSNPRMEAMMRSSKTGLPTFEYPDFECCRTALLKGHNAHVTFLKGGIHHQGINLPSRQEMKSLYGVYRNYFSLTYDARYDNLMRYGGVSCQQALSIRSLRSTFGDNCTMMAEKQKSIAKANHQLIQSVYAIMRMDPGTAATTRISNLEFIPDDVILRMEPPGLENPPFELEVYDWKDETQHPISKAPFPSYFPHVKFVIASVSSILFVFTVLVEESIKRLFADERTAAIAKESAYKSHGVAAYQQVVLNRNCFPYPASITSSVFDAKAKELVSLFSLSLFLQYDAEKGVVARKKDIQIEMDLSDEPYEGDDDDDSKEPVIHDNSHNHTSFIGRWNNTRTCMKYAFAFFHLACSLSTSCMPRKRLTGILKKTKVSVDDFNSTVQDVRLGCSVAKAYCDAKGEEKKMRNPATVVGELFPPTAFVMSLLRYTWETIKRQLADYHAAVSGANANADIWKPIQGTDFTQCRAAMRIQLTAEYLFTIVENRDGRHDDDMSQRVRTYFNTKTKTSDSSFVVVAIINASLPTSSHAGYYFTASRLNSIMHKGRSHHMGNSVEKDLQNCGFSSSALLQGAGEVLNAAERLVKFTVLDKSVDERNFARKKLQDAFREYERRDNNIISVACLKRPDALQPLSLALDL